MIFSRDLLTPSLVDGLHSRVTALVLSAPEGLEDGRAGSGRSQWSCTQAEACFRPRALRRRRRTGSAFSRAPPSTPSCTYYVTPAEGGARSVRGQGTSLAGSAAAFLDRTPPGVNVVSPPRPSSRGAVGPGAARGVTTYTNDGSTRLLLC